MGRTSQSMNRTAFYPYISAFLFPGFHIKNLISTKAPQVAGLPKSQGTSLWEASLWAKVCRR